MKKKLRALLNSSSFYAGLALCLLAVGVGGYALFSGGEQTDPAEDTPDVPVTAPVPEEVEPPAVEAAAPAEVETGEVLARVLACGKLREMTLKEQNVDQLIARMYQEMAL